MTPEEEKELKEKFQFLTHNDFAWDTTRYGTRITGLTKTSEVIDFVSQLLKQRERALVEKIKQLEAPAPTEENSQVLEYIHDGYFKAIEDCLSLLENK